MLFDTQSPNRRRFVQITFAFLALLMGGGLVLFGIGGATSGGGLVDAVNGNSPTAGSTAKKDAESAQKALDANPKDQAASLKLARANLTLATQNAFDQSGNVVKDGQPVVTAADNAWTAYLALGPTKPDPGVAIQYSSFYALPGVAKYDKAARAMEAVLVTRKPTSGLYAQLAIYSLATGDQTKYKDARERSLALATSKTRRDAIAKQLDSIAANIKKQTDAAAKAQADAQKSGDSAGTTPKLPTLPTLQ